MKREQLIHAIRAAAQIVQQRELIVIGSQAILGSFSEEELPPEATYSNEIDIMPLNDDDAATLARKLDVIGEYSDFHEQHQFYVDGVSRRTATLPAGWEDRLIRVKAGSVIAEDAYGYCVEPHDLCVAKLLAHRQKDKAFVGALVREEIVDPKLLRQRLMATTPKQYDNYDHAISWVDSHIRKRESASSPLVSNEQQASLDLINSQMRNPGTQSPGIH
ncbi:DUF6036 family nucleotidyltransferase [Nesterenkonia alkaliphila]|uniref:DUF6036 domain-containing protein n=1 Tax=Nesterenkonia alkaliphila TaxID=1463631 RepID=A0A7K1UIK4_9MICC|nr:DUF6036 family nucleotidyltransferase [Nesterenkonia alkaliphila]MVT26246.1 hypothetical protein [Nesterenkonia alkaliphila]GFZ99453.1 hypothetical protein GCM10011359_30530 [Nesterenkonia alkaliphila]